MAAAHLQSGCEASRHLIEDDGRFPNNPNVPLVIARQVLTTDCSAEAFEALFRRNEWMPAWRAGIFDFDHYHSTAHEVLGCFSGSASLQFGGGANCRIHVKAGDAIIIPAGVAHRCISADNFVCVGAYPKGQSWDTCMGEPSERPEADARIRALGNWTHDPLYAD